MGFVTWIENLVGICCLVVPLWLVPELVLEFYTGRYVRLGFLTVLGYGGLVTALLLIGSIGMSLLTGNYHDHRKAFHRVWLIIGILATVSVLWSWAAAIGVR